jgi:hypothetical protein
MFNTLIADHHAKQAALREDNERLRRTAAESVGKVRERGMEFEPGCPLFEPGCPLFEPGCLRMEATTPL